MGDGVNVWRGESVSVCEGGRVSVCGHNIWRYAETHTFTLFEQKLPGVGMLLWALKSQSLIFPWHTCSLVPRLFPPPVLLFDCLQYANTEEEGLGDLVTCSDVHGTCR